MPEDIRHERAEAILRATAFAVDRFSTEPWDAVVAETLGAAAEATGVERISVFERVVAEEGQTTLRERFRWPVDGPAVTGADALADRLVSGEVVLEPAAVTVPVFAGDEPWGWVRYTSAGRTWSAAEIESFKMYARILGDAIAQERLGREAREAVAWLETHIANLPAVTYIEFTDGDHQLGYDEAYVSPQIFDMFGYTPEEWLRDEEDPLWLGSEYIHPDDREEVVRLAAETAETGEPYLAEYRMRHGRTGEYIWVRDEAHLVEGGEGVRPYWHGVIVDITERKKMEEQIEFLAYHDSLTGLANRKLFQEMLEPALARARRHDLAVAVLFMDLDNFKQVNDTLGHDMGDLLLKQVSARLTETTRETDLVARQGGDEFLVMIPDIEPGRTTDEGQERAVEVAEMMAQRIHAALRMPFDLGDTEVTTSMSVGISVFPLDATDVRTLLKNADAAMYETKRAGRGGAATYSRSGVDPLVQGSLTTRLRQAVKDQPWVLHYQPMVELETGAMTGIEALLRWRKPKGDLLLPREFIPLAEEMGLLEIIGEWVLDELTMQVLAWRDAGLDLPVSFNLSPRQLWQRDLADKLSARFGEADIDPSMVIVEVSEATAMTDPARTQRILWALHEHGFKLAIDDFGTGYSPPARLKNLPVDILKIDHPLVRDLPDDPEVGGFVGAVIRFATDLGITTLAEGIETAEQRGFLIAKACASGQGYLFSRPLSGSDLRALWTETGGRLAG